MTSGDPLSPCTLDEALRAVALDEWVRPYTTEDAESDLLAPESGPGETSEAASPAPGTPSARHQLAE